ncbi:putative gag-pol polyprotein, partial [Trifolium medium]|nr:putative gag-pol polyprotein [Trifolium medium]
IKHEFSSPITPQQNEVAERKNRTIQESARVMLHAKQLSYHFWGEAMNTACYIHNRVTIRKDDAPISKLPDAATNVAPSIPQGPLEIEEGEPQDVNTDDEVFEVRQPTASKDLEKWSPTPVLYPRPDGINIIGTKWIYRNKSDENGTVTRNKARLVAQGYTQIEGVDFDETFAPVARLESKRLLLGLACILKFKLFQMDVKSVFLNRYLHEEVYVEQPKGFIDPNLPNHAYKLKKALYGLKQAPRAWYERLTKFLVSHGYRKR